MPCCFAHVSKTKSPVLEPCLSVQVYVLIGLVAYTVDRTLRLYRYSLLFLYPPFPSHNVELPAYPTRQVDCNTP